MNEVDVIRRHARNQIRDVLGALAYYLGMFALGWALAALDVPLWLALIVFVEAAMVPVVIIVLQARRAARALRRHHMRRPLS